MISKVDADAVPPHVAPLPELYLQTLVGALTGRAFAKFIQHRFVSLFVNSGNRNLDRRSIANSQRDFCGFTCNGLRAC